MIIFLDFDGVLRRLSSPYFKFDADCLECFESTVRPHDVGIVISSAWRLDFSLTDIKSHFSLDIAEKIIGITPESLKLVQHYRYNEVLAYLKKECIGKVNWVAVDDDPAHYPESCPVIFTDPMTGFNNECARKLHDFLLSGV